MSLRRKKLWCGIRICNFCLDIVLKVCPKEGLDLLCGDAESSPRSSVGLGIKNFRLISPAPEGSGLSHRVKRLHLYWMLWTDPLLSISPLLHYGTPILPKYYLPMNMGDGPHLQLQGWTLISPSHSAHGLLLGALTGLEVCTYPRLAQLDLKEAFVFRFWGEISPLSCWSYIMTH